MILASHNLVLGIVLLNIIFLLDAYLFLNVIWVIAARTDQKNEKVDWVESLSLITCLTRHTAPTKKTNEYFFNS